MASLTPNTPRPWSEFRDGFLRSYSELLFTPSRAVGLIFVVATLVQPKTAIYGVVAALVGLLTTKLLGFSDEANRQGLFGYNALLVGLAIGAGFEPGLSSLTLLIGATVTAVVTTASLRSLFGVFGLPPLSLPFLLVVLALLTAAPTLGMSYSYDAFRLGEAFGPLPLFLSDFLVTLGAIFFVPHAVAGLVVLIGLLLSSRIATLLAVVGYLLAAAIGATAAEIIPQSAQLFLTITTVVVAIAIGGVWFIPSASSLLLVVGSSIVGAVFAIANYALLRGVGYPVLFLPLNMTIWLVLLAMRQRMRDARPNAVYVVGASPEANLTHFRNRVARFGAHYFTRFRAPFLGRWVCTQSAEGEVTHQSYWKHALDFEVRGHDGALFENDGSNVEHYHCYGLPILAPADGTIVHVESDVPDNAIGEVNLRHNWGNHVLIAHGNGVYSLCAHLMPGRSNVWEGQAVRRGDEIGRCGNSGRSPVPHLHFQLQTSPIVGAPTVVTELHDVIVERDDGEVLCNTFVPAKGDEVRNVNPEPGALIQLVPAADSITFELDGARTETVEAAVDMLNRRVLRSNLGAELVYETDELVFTIHEVTGAPKSVLHMMRLALGRLPLEIAKDLRWHDHLPRGYTQQPPARWLFDFVAPFLPNGGARINYRGRTEGTQIVIEGTSDDDLRTLAKLDDHGVVELSVTRGTKTHRARRIEAVEAAPRENAAAGVLSAATVIESEVPR